MEENPKKPGRNSKNSKNLEEIQKTWRKFQKTYGHPVFLTSQIHKKIQLFHLD